MPPVLTYKRAQSLGIHARSIALPPLHARSPQDPEWGRLWGARPPHRQGEAPILKVWLGKMGRQLPPAWGERRSGEGGGGEGGRYHWDALLACTAQPRCRARRGAQPMNATKSARALPRERPSSCPEHFAPTAASNTPYIHTRVQCRKLPAHTARLTDTHNEHNSPAPGLHRGEGGGPRARLQPRSIGVPPTPPPPPPPSRPHRVGQPGAPRYRQRTIRAGSGRCGAGRSGPPPPGRPPPCAASVGRGGGEREEKPREGPTN